MTDPRRRRFSADFEQPHQIFRFLLHLDVTVAQHPERALAPDPVTGEQARDEDRHHRLQPDEADRLLGFALARQTNEAIELRRDRHERVHGLERAFAHELEPKGETEIGDERKGMGGIDRDRRQHREDVVEEVRLQPFALMIGKLVGAQHVNAGFGEQCLERDPAFLLLRGQLGDGAVDAVELLGGRQPVLARRFDAGKHLAAQARHADHVELVEVRGGDRQEAQALEQRMALVLGFLQHPLIELEPGQLAIEKAARSKGGDPRTGFQPVDLLWQTHL